jgi:biopolymer transport protein ExbD
MSGSVSSEVRAEPNLTPLLDVVFQLITFFMMVINFSQDNYDQRVRLPVAGSARPVEARPNEDRLVLNIDRDGHLLFNGQSYDTERAMQEIAKQANLVRLNIEVTTGKKPKPSEALPTILVIRADRDTPFSQFFRLVSACQANGFQKFALKAMNEGG